MRRPPRTPMLALLLAALMAGLTAGAPPISAAQQGCSFGGRLQMSPETLADGAPVQGPADAELLLVEFFDPNCPHCQRFKPVVDRVLQQYGDRVRYYKQPVPLWPFSRPQIRAIMLAKEQGKYYEMIDAQLTSPNAGKGGLSTDQIVGLAEDIGIEPGWMREQLRSGAMKAAVNRLPYEARKAGVSSTPTLAIGRKIVANRSAACIGRLIEQELAATSEAGADSERR